MKRTTTLYAMPSFLRGMSAVLDIGATLTVYNESKNAHIADAKAIRADWQAIGEDIYVVMDRWESEYVKS